jgi:hypothetical protein
MSTPKQEKSISDLLNEIGVSWLDVIVEAIRKGAAKEIKNWLFFRFHFGVDRDQVEKWVKQRRQKISDILENAEKRTLGLYLRVAAQGLFNILERRLPASGFASFFGITRVLGLNIFPSMEEETVIMEHTTAEQRLAGKLQYETELQEWVNETFGNKESKGRTRDV